MTPVPRLRPRRRTSLAALAAWGLGLVLSQVSLAHAGPPAGTPIDNTATGVASDSSGTVQFAPVASNTVRAIVQPLEWLVLTPGRATRVNPGAGTVFAHRLFNLGNGASDVRLTFANQPGDDFDADGLALVEDLDRDGAIGPGDAPVASGGLVTLAAGDSLDLLLAATAPATAPGLADARLSLSAAARSGNASAAAQDTLRTTVAGGVPTLAFFAGPDYGAVTRVSALGVPLYVQAWAPRCDADPDRPDTVRITLHSRGTGDADTYLAVETGPSTGIFRIGGAPTAFARPGFAVSGDGVLEQVRGDEITAVLPGCGAPETRAQVWIEPGGTVFDSRTGTPVAGARVLLVDVTGAGNGGQPGAPAQVLAADGVTSAPAEVVTGADGRFVFALVRTSSYRLVVAPPTPWKFPSQLAGAQLPAGWSIDPAGSFGAAFAVSGDPAPVLLDVPVDADAPVVLFAEKTASVASVEWGDALDYTVRVANRSDSTLTAVTLDDRLPSGFAYAAGSARRDTVALADPAGGGGAALTFAIGALGPHEETRIRYRVHVGPGAPAGTARNEAVASSGATHSNVASASVLVRGDAFDDAGLVVGTVWYDANRDGRAGASEAGLAGVRLYLDDGTFAITDERGRYSFTGLTPRTHALKLDATTLPPSASVAASGRRDAGTPGLRFVDLTRGDLVRADFAVVGDTTVLREATERRQAVAHRAIDERSRLVARGADALASGRALGDPRALPAEGVATGERDLPVVTRASGVDTAPPAPASTPATSAAVAGIEPLLATLEPDLGFVGLDDLDTVLTDQVAVLVKGPLGATLALRVNGKTQPETRVGRRFTAAQHGLEAWEYVGVALKPGVNVLEVAPPRSVGRVAVRVVAPGPFARLTLEGPHAVPADGHSVAMLVLHARDAAGVPCGARTLVTLDGAGARFTAKDLDPATPGLQVAIEGGAARVPVVAPATAGRVTITAASGEARTAATIVFVPDLRPLLAVGAFEGVLSLARHHGPGRAAPAGFEAPITQFANASRDGDASAAAHGALFVKGRVRDDVLVTLGYDSDRPADQRQFRDQQPDRGYPVFGDAGTRGWEAQSTGHLYARAERARSAVLYGDFVTGSAGGRSLANYGRSLTGAAAHWELERASLDAFTSRDHSRRVVEELRGRGISGPYVLTHGPVLENSERVEVLVRDRAQPALVLTATAKQRFTDYELEPLTGRLLFRAPVPSVDADLNPVSIRVTYESATDGAPAWVHGLEGHARLTDRIDLGGTYVDDHDPAAPSQLRGVELNARLAGANVLEAEWAATRHLGGAHGDAGRVELRHQDATTQARLYGVATATAFDNPGAGYTGGRSEAGGTFATRLAGRTRVSAEALFSADAAGRQKRGGLLLGVDRPLSEALRGEFGVRFSREIRTANAPGVATGPASTSLRARLAAQWPKHPDWSGYSEFEQDTRQADRRMAAVGGEWRFDARGRLYTRHEILSSLSSAWALAGAQQQNTSVVGIDAELAGETHLFSEYRLGDAIAGRESQAAVGLRNGWKLANGLAIGTTFERVTPILGSSAGPSTAVTGSVDFTDDDTWKGSSRAEVRTSRASDQFLQSFAAAVRLDPAWTGLMRHLLTLDDTHGHGNETHERLQTALAWRTGRAWDGLARWEFRYDHTSPLDAPRHVHVANVAGLVATGRAGAWEPSLGWAGKLTRDKEPGGPVTAGGAQWLHGRLTRDLGTQYALALTGSVLLENAWSRRQDGLGAEASRLLPGGAWLSLGFNRFGFTDDELAGEEWTREGAYLRVRVRFDETMFTRPREVKR